MIDLDYAEDSTAETDANFVMTGSGGLVEVQGSAEGAPFSEAELLKMLALARGGDRQIVALQKAAIGISDGVGRLAPTYSVALRRRNSSTPKSRDMQQKAQMTCVVEITG